MIELSLAICLEAGRCRELKGDQLYRSIGECEADAKKTILDNESGLAKLGYYIQGFTCRRAD